MNRPVIFLDFDGVLNTEQYQARLVTEGKPTKDAWGPLFDPRAVENLSRIIEATDADIVVSSSWRYAYKLGSLRQMWEARELPGELRDTLACGATYISRGEEIKYWLESHNSPDYVVIDDLDDFLPSQHHSYVETNPIVGITDSDADKAIEILRRSSEFLRKLTALRNSEQAKAWRDGLTQMRREAIAGMHARHAFLSDIVNDFSTLEDFARAKGEFFEMMGVEFEQDEKMVSLYFQLDYNNYEQYFVVPTADGRLAVSHIIWWQNEVCANEMLNIFTGETCHDDDAIYTTY